MTDDQLEQFCRQIVDAWDMDTTIDYCITNLFSHYKDNPDELAEELEQW